MTAMTEPRVGDTVEVPGNMHGTVKFIGQVDGKKGIFAGVQLAPEYAARGKNSGEVDGRHYFRTTKPGSGIFLPVEKAIRKSIRKSSPTTPQTPSFANGGRTPLAVLPKPNFSQSIGPGARAGSPASKTPGRRPSLPRPSSPVRQTPGRLTTPKTRPSIGLAKSTIGGAPQYRASTSTKTKKFSTSLRGPSATTPAKKQLGPLGPEAAFDEEPETTPTPTPAAVARSVDQRVQEEEIKRLKSNLEEKDRQLKEQAASLADMEKSLTELQSLLPEDAPSPRKHARGSSGPDDVSQLRAMLRDKNEKIRMLTVDFDSTRADFRSTIDALETASTETERVYEQRVDDLLQQVRELQDRGEDVESVAQQFKQLEELVQELEEGLESSRRSETEAREEVEFLRGEVERSRSELSHMRERSAASSGRSSPDGQGDLIRELEQRDDEIRGLKAIIHSLNREPMSSPPMMNGQTNGYGHTQSSDTIALQRKIKELEALIERKAYREEELESELDRLRSTTSSTAMPRSNKHHSASTVRSNRLSDRTVVPTAITTSDQPPLETMHESADARSTDGTSTSSATLWCEICETGGHDILTCTNMFGEQSRPQLAQRQPGSTTAAEQRFQSDGQHSPADNFQNDRPAPLKSRKSFDAPPPAPSEPLPLPTPERTSSLQTVMPQKEKVVDVKQTPQPDEAGMVAGKTSGVVDEGKWCALCERDGHDSVDCPFEDAF